MFLSLHHQSTIQRNSSARVIQLDDFWQSERRTNDASETFSLGKLRLEINAFRILVGDVLPCSRVKEEGRAGTFVENTNEPI